MKNTEKTMDKIVELCKSRGFVFPGSEIYGGLANTWDYGPLGVLLKNNIKAAWLRKFVQECKYNVGLDSAILMNPQTWVASGHIGGFSDPLMDCKECKTRHRADNLIEAFDGTNPAGWTNEQMMDYIREHNIPCPNCGKHNFTDIRQLPDVQDLSGRNRRQQERNIPQTRNGAGHFRKLRKHPAYNPQKDSLRCRTGR